jgi:hypothetical protein
MDPVSPNLHPSPPPSEGDFHFSVGTILGKGFGLFFKNAPAFLLIALIVYLPLLAYGILADPFSGNRSVEDLQRSLLLYLAIFTGGGLLLQNLTIAAVTYGVVEQLNGRHASIGKCLAVGARRMLPTLAVTIVVALCIVAGVLALVVGALVVYCVLYVAVPASVIEQNGVGRALSRSAFLTKGHRWGIFGLVLVLGIFGGIAAFALESIFIEKLSVGIVEIIHPDHWKRYVVLQTSIQMVFGAIGATMVATSYVAFRNEKDGVQVGELAKVFD